MDDVGREENELKERDVGGPGSRGYFRERVIVKKLAVVFFDSGPRIVKKIHAPRGSFQVGHENVIGVLFVLKEFELFGFDRVFGDTTTNR